MARAVRRPRSAAAGTEALRGLRSNLLVAVAELDHPVVMVTSARPAEGKTAICAGLARSLAAAGTRVVLVDLDLRRPDLHERLGATDRVGVVEVIGGQHGLAEAIQFVEPGFYFLAAGRTAANAPELLGTPAMAELLESTAAQADIVLVDTAPVLPVADTLVVARLATGAVLVVEAGRTSETDVQSALDALARSGVQLLGVALNKLDAREVRLGYGSGAWAEANHDAGPMGARWVAGWAQPAR